MLKYVLEIIFYIITIVGLILAVIRFLFVSKQQKAMEEFLKMHKLMTNVRSLLIKKLSVDIIEVMAKTEKEISIDVETIYISAHKNEIDEMLTEIECIATAYNTCCLLCPISRSAFNRQFSTLHHKPLVSFFLRYIDCGIKETANKRVMEKNYFDQTKKMFIRLVKLKKHNINSL